MAALPDPGRRDPRGGAVRHQPLPHLPRRIAGRLGPGGHRRDRRHARRAPRRHVRRRGPEAADLVAGAHHGRRHRVGARVRLAHPRCGREQGGEVGRAHRQGRQHARGRRVELPLPGRQLRRARRHPRDQLRQQGGFAHARVRRAAVLLREPRRARRARTSPRSTRCRVRSTRSTAPFPATVPPACTRRITVGPKGGKPEAGTATPTTTLAGSPRPPPQPNGQSQVDQSSQSGNQLGN